MKKTKQLTAIAVLLGTGLSMGAAFAAPDGSQKLRGLEGRVFLVTVEVVRDDFGVFEFFFGAPVGTTFPNCYAFNADDWTETGFPTTGTWSQDSVGARTGYVVTNNEGLEQLGFVSPAGGKGVLQLQAVSTINPAGLEFFSVGAEVQGSDITDCPTFPPPFTPPEDD